MSKVNKLCAHFLLFLLYFHTLNLLFPLLFYVISTATPNFSFWLPASPPGFPAFFPFPPRFPAFLTDSQHSHFILCILTFILCIPIILFLNSSFWFLPVNCLRINLRINFKKIVTLVQI